MNRASYGASLALLVLAYVVMVNVMKRPPGAEVLVGLIAVPRLHDMGRSGWWLLPLLAGELAAVAVGWQYGDDGILIAGGLYVLFCLILLIILGFIPGQDGPNRWGDRPIPGVHLLRSKRQTSEN